VHSNTFVVSFAVCSNALGRLGPEESSRASVISFAACSNSSGRRAIGLLRPLRQQLPGVRRLEYFLVLTKHLPQTRSRQHDKKQQCLFRDREAHEGPNDIGTVAIAHQHRVDYF